MPVGVLPPFIKADVVHALSLSKGIKVKALFYKSRLFPPFPKEDCFVEGSQTLTVFPAGKRQHVYEDEYGAMEEC